MENAKKKHTGSNILIILLILIILASTGVGLYSWAKYRTTVEGTATGEVAKWNFNVTDGNSQTEAIDFTLTRTDNNDSVVDGKLAPGTCGELEIGIDATGTETALTYIIEGEMSNLPTNLKLYSNEERTEELIVVNNKFSKGGYMSLQEIGARKEKIYWEWPFETGTTTEEKTANNKIDTEDSGKTMNINITVTGRQVNGEPRLADLVQIGDYVNYDANSNGLYTFTSDDCTNLAGTGISANFSSSDVFNSGTKSQWRVLSVDRKTGTVELVASDVIEQTVVISGGAGFLNAETILNNICAIYGHGKGANGGRSIKLEDVEQYSTYDPYTMFSKNTTSTGYYGGTRKYTSGVFYKEKKDSSGKVIDYISQDGEGDKVGLPFEATSDNPIEMTQTFYQYDAQKYFASSTIFNMIFKSETNGNNLGYVLASRSTDLHSSDECRYFLFNIWGSGVRYTATVLKSNDENYNLNSTQNPKIRPVVSLNTNIQTTGQSADGVWQLKVD
ncbi:MAG: hypothetical protein E7313_06895 [Clostridiales bacterium]|nr:hypothetical protein [Clostridiales bacterium]